MLKSAPIAVLQSICTNSKKTDYTEMEKALKNDEIKRLTISTSAIFSFFV
jgi:hypothetical protein